MIMKAIYTYQQIVGSPLFNKTRERFLIGAYELVKRPASFSLRLEKEDSRIIRRIILLPPGGFTADKINLLSPHPEARTARVKILGKIRPDNKGFAPVNKEVEFIFSLSGEAPTELSSSYSNYSKSFDKYYDRQLKSWKNWFYVVKENGRGNFHNLINLSGDWVVLLLEKELSDRKNINIEKLLKQLAPAQAEALKQVLKRIEIEGDGFFRDKLAVNNLLRIDHGILVSVLIRMLNFKETGKHEPCTFFALLLKIVKLDKKLVSREVNKALKFKIAPVYYLQDLKRKMLKI